MISNTKDIWRLESKWSDYDRFWTDHDRKLPEVSYDFFLNFTCAHKHSSQRSYNKLRKNTETSAEERVRITLVRGVMNNPITVKC